MKKQDLIKTAEELNEILGFEKSDQIKTEGTIKEMTAEIKEAAEELMPEDELSKNTIKVLKELGAAEALGLPNAAEKPKAEEKQEPGSDDAKVDDAPEEKPAPKKKPVEKEAKKEEQEEEKPVLKKKPKAGSGTTEEEGKEEAATKNDVTPEKQSSSNFKRPKNKFNHFEDSISGRIDAVLMGLKSATQKDAIAKKANATKARVSAHISHLKEKHGVKFTENENGVFPENL